MGTAQAEPAMRKIGAGSASPSERRVIAALGTSIAQADLEQTLHQLHGLGVHHSVSATPRGVHGGAKTVGRIFTYHRDPLEHPGALRCYEATSTRHHGNAGPGPARIATAKAFAIFCVLEPHAHTHYTGPPRPEDHNGAATTITALDRMLMTTPLEALLAHIFDLGMRYTMTGLSRSLHREGEFTATIALQSGGEGTGTPIRTIRRYESGHARGSIKGALCAALAAMLQAENVDYHVYTRHKTVAQQGNANA